MAYLIDTNCFIEAKNFYYQFDFCPGYWDGILVAHQSGQAHSVQAVEGELIRGGDELAEWVKSKGKPIFLAPDGDVTTSYGQVVNWVNGQRQYDRKDIARFSGGADPWLIAHAHAHNHIVVTREQSVPPNSTKVKIPNVCAAFGVIYVSPFEMMRSIGISLRI